MFTFAGTKDRQAKTSQLMSAYRVEAERLASLNEAFCKRRIGIRLGNFTYCERPVRLGQLVGNRFAIVVREVHLPPLLQQCGDVSLSEHVDKCVRALRERGFPNYFGRQRFGSWSVPTPSVGREMLHSRWSAAVDLLLRASELNTTPTAAPAASTSSSQLLKRKGEPLENEPVVCKQPALEEVAPDDDDDRLEADADADVDAKCGAASAETDTTRSRRLTGLERKLQQAVRQSGRTLQALQQLPRTVRLLYLHSYQSLVWNRVLSRRLRELGAQLLVGDLVLPRASATPAAGDGAGALAPAPNASCEPDAYAEAEAEDEMDADTLSAAREPLVVTQEDLEAGKYSFYELVLPLPGFRIRLPNNQSAYALFTLIIFTRTVRSDAIDFSSVISTQ